MRQRRVTAHELRRALSRPSSAAGSEKISWRAIGVDDRRCRGCGRRLELDDVAHFGTDVAGARFVECGDCFGGPSVASA